MKQALILHGTDGTPNDNWFLWLKTELEKRNYKVFVPQLPDADYPNIDKYKHFLLNNGEFKINAETTLIGHSSGAVAILGILESLDQFVIEKSILIGSFKDDLGWENLKQLFKKEFDFGKIQTHCKEFILIHSDNDPFCPLDHARYLSSQLNGKLIVIPGQQHFSISTAGNKYKKFPELLKYL